MRPALHPLLAALAALCTLGLPGLGPPPLAAAPAVSTSNRGPVGTLALASYLSKFGYIPKLDPQSPHLRALTGGIKDLQRFAGLPATGVVDAALEELLRRPRCGMLDMDGAGRASRARRHVPRHALRQLEQLRHAHRRRRYTARQDMKWHNTLEVSWR
ncbi:hypothetical protein ONE63_000492 [Megalurothrips usitatus]|uniref:Peptidoglycan binding-like domain-containing protein n=1 Tax=Megalurothrips usitatus TaxID=439358 RepID=A0AAV7Y5Q7_9NEOP|nr:hypothetical protein ONE63_000492 [Megalurothrips usitatus]